MRALLISLLILPTVVVADFRVALGGSYRPSLYESVGLVNTAWQLPYLDRRLAIVAQFDQRLAFTQWEDNAQQWTTQSFGGVGVELKSHFGLYASTLVGGDVAFLTVIEPTQEAFADIAAVPAVNYQLGYRASMSKWYAQISAHGQTRFQSVQLDVAPYLSRQTVGEVEWYEKTLPATTEWLQFVAFSIGYDF